MRISKWARLTAQTSAAPGIRGATFTPNFFGEAITLAQIYTTASYQAHDLTGVVFNTLNLSGGNFAGRLSRTPHSRATP